MKRIGLTQRVDEIADYMERRDCLDQRWSELLIGLGWLPVILPNLKGLIPDDVFDRFGLDGIIFTGGNSLQVVEPKHRSVAPERDMFERLLIAWAVERGKPILGVCRGMQIINSYFGGDLKRVTNHVAVEHELRVATKEYDLPGTVNSFHDWGIPPQGLAKPLNALAYYKEGNVEAFQHKSEKVLGIMWHPERDLPMSCSEIKFFRRVFA